MYHRTLIASPLPLQLSTKKKAKTWAYAFDPLEEDASYKHYVKLVGVGVPRDTIAAKLSRDGVNAAMVRKENTEKYNTIFSANTWHVLNCLSHKPNCFLVVFDYWHVLKQ